MTNNHQTKSSIVNSLIIIFCTISKVKNLNIKLVEFFFFVQKTISNGWHCESIYVLYMNFYKMNNFTILGHTILITCTFDWKWPRKNNNIGFSIAYQLLSIPRKNTKIRNFACSHLLHPKTPEKLVIWGGLKCTWLLNFFTVYRRSCNVL